MYGPLPTGFFSQASWSSKRRAAGGAKAGQPRVSGKVENFWLSLTVKVRGPVTFSPESVSALCSPLSGCVLS